MELFTINGRSLDILNDTGFKKIIDPLIKHIKKKNPARSKFQINARLMQSEINRKYSEIKNDIKNLVKDKLININFDALSRKDKTMLGIHVQVLCLEGLRVKTLAMIEFTKDTRPAYLKKKVC